MIYLNAQPDDEYFIWQLDLLIRNLNSLQILKNNIHILVAYDSKVGVKHNMQVFSDEMKELAEFYFYPDTRKFKNYISSIRPHIIKKHYKSNKWLESKTIFYHDSDILFTKRLPSFSSLDLENSVYMSNTRDYLGVEYIDNRGSKILGEMAQELVIPEDTIRENYENVGGAQIIIKNIDYHFWHKIEIDCFKLYVFLCKNETRYLEEYKKEFPNERSKLVSSWCSDMWAILWNCYTKFNVKIIEELDFCWPSDALNRWEDTYIFHNAGVDNTFRKQYFYKGDFYSYSPFNRNFSYVLEDSCSSLYINQFKSIPKQKINYFKNTAFILFGKEQYKNLVIDYLETYITKDIFWLNDGEILNMDSQLFERFSKITLLNTEYLVDINKLVALQNATENVVYTCIGYNLSGLSNVTINNLKTTFDTSLLSKYLTINEVKYFHKYSCLTISREFLKKLSHKSKFIINESILRFLSYRILVNGRLKCLEKNIKTNYDII